MTDALSEWDPFATFHSSQKLVVILATQIFEGQSMEERVDEVTFLTRKVIIETRRDRLKTCN